MTNFIQSLVNWVACHLVSLVFILFAGVGYLLWQDSSTIGESQLQKQAVEPVVEVSEPADTLASTTDAGLVGEPAEADITQLPVEPDSVTAAKQKGEVADAAGGSDAVVNVPKPELKRGPETGPQSELKPQAVVEPQPEELKEIEVATEAVGQEAQHQLSPQQPVQPQTDFAQSIEALPAFDQQVTETAPQIPQARTDTDPQDETNLPPLITDAETVTVVPPETGHAQSYASGWRPPGMEGDQLMDEQYQRQSLLQQARRAYWNNQVKQAVAYYKQYLSLYPDDAYGFGELGNLYFSMGREQQAMDSYFQAGRMFRQQGDLSGLQSVAGLLRQMGDQRAQVLLAE